MDVIDINLLLYDQFLAKIQIGVQPQYLVDVLKNSTKLSTNEGVSTT
jgi:hypothetical protein